MNPIYRGCWAAFRPWRSALGTVCIYIAIRKIRPGLARFFCSYAGHVWKHGNLSTDAGSRISTGGKVAFWRSALGTIGIYIYPLKEFHWGRPGNFPRMQGMCGSMEPISKMWGAAFRPRVWRSALGGTRSGRLVSPTVSVAAAAVAANASARERSMLVRAVVREREWVRTAPESRVSGGYIGYKSPGLNCTESALAAQVSQRRRP